MLSLALTSRHASLSNSLTWTVRLSQNSELFRWIFYLVAFGDESNGEADVSLSNLVFFSASLCSHNTWMWTVLIKGDVGMIVGCSQLVGSIWKAKASEIWTTRVTVGSLCTFHPCLSTILFFVVLFSLFFRFAISRSLQSHRCIHANNTWDNLVMCRGMWMWSRRLHQAWKRVLALGLSFCIHIDDIMT
jgi:hypothetical protein